MAYLKTETYKTRSGLITDLKNEVLRDFTESDYEESDRLAVAMHKVVDNFVSYISPNDLKTYLNYFTEEDNKTLDKGLLPQPYDHFNEKHRRALLYCLVEQDLYNDDVLNSLQDYSGDKNKLLGKASAEIQAVHKTAAH